jgi:hypothetical protein
VSEQPFDLYSDKREVVVTFGEPETISTDDGPAQVIAARLRWSIPVLPADPTFTVTLKLRYPDGLHANVELEASDEVAEWLDAPIRAFTPNTWKD